MNEYVEALRALADWLEGGNLPDRVTVNTEFTGFNSGEVSFHTRGFAELVMGAVGVEFNADDRTPPRWFTSESGFLGFAEVTVYA